MEVSRRAVCYGGVCDSSSSLSPRSRRSSGFQRENDPVACDFTRGLIGARNAEESEERKSTSETKTTASAAASSASSATSAATSAGAAGAAAAAAKGGDSGVFSDPQYYLSTGWNLNNLPFYPGSVLRHVHEKVNGINMPWVYIGMLFCAFCWHNEDNYLYSTQVRRGRWGGVGCGV